MTQQGEDTGRALASRVEGATGGDRAALDDLLEGFRPYLLAVANAELAGGLRGKVGGSDLVQETLLDAVADRDGFLGAGPDGLKGWLRAILRNNAADLARRFRAAGKRDPARERADSDAIAGLADPRPTPGTLASAREEAAALDAALARLADDDRAVILLRNRDHLPWDEVGRRLGRSDEAARKLWARAVGRLQRLLGDGPA